jgi:hypothetical protein
MGLTETSVLLPLCVVCAFWPGALLFLVRYFGVLGGSAILVFGDFGMATAIAPGALLVGNVALQWLLGKSYRGRLVLRIAAPLIVAALYAVATAMILPWVFDGAVMVFPQKPAFFGSIPLHFGMGNITQCFYLAIDVTFLVCAALVLAERDSDLGRHFRAYLTAGYLIAAIAVWQFANKVAGVPFPSDFFYSNPGWAELTEQSFGGLARINGPFTEPAALASTMCGFAFCTGWLLLQGYRQRALLPLLVISVFCILLSTSTTGFIGLAVGLLYIALHALSTARPAFRARLLRFVAPGAGLALLGMLLLPIFAPQVLTSLGIVVSQTLDKTNSTSYDERSTMDGDAIGVVLDTYGLGAGYGSNRPSSLIPSLLSQIGIAGVTLVVLFVFRLGSRVRHARAVAVNHDVGMIVQGFAAALTGTGVTVLIAGPNIPSLDFYLTLSLLIAAIVQSERSAAGLFAASERPSLRSAVPPLPHTAPPPSVSAVTPTLPPVARVDGPLAPADVDAS